MIVFVGTCCAAAMLVVAAASETVLAEENEIRVRVLLFSGRPDPVFTLDNKSLIDKIKKGVSEAEPDKNFPKNTVIPSILGYKGIRISNPERLEGLPLSLAFYNGAMEVTDGQEHFFKDKNGALEKMLMDEAVRQGVIDKVILERMRKKQ